MTHWKRLLFYPWAFGVAILIGLWSTSLYKGLEVSVQISDTNITLASQDNSISTSYIINTWPSPHKRSKFFDVQYTKPTKRVWPEWSDYTGKFKYFSRGSAEGHPLYHRKSLTLPIYFLLILHTAFFALLYLLAHRHYRKKTAALPTP